MNSRYCKLILLSIFLLICSNLYTFEVYIDDFQINGEDPTDNEEILILFRNKLLQTSTNSITYRYISDIDTSENLDILPVKNTLGALAVCFFYNIDYILFGEIFMEPDINEYLAIVKLYSKEENQLIYDLRYSKKATSQDEFFLGLAYTLNQELTVTLQDELQLENERLEQARIEAEIMQQERLEQERLEEEQLEQEQTEEEKSEEEMDNNPEETEDEEDNTENTDKNSIFGIFTSLGYYFILNSEWKEYIRPTMYLEFGIKLAFEPVDNEKFDFLLRPGLLFSYSFAFNRDREGRIIHYHSLASRLLLEACFEFSDKFDFFIGSGVVYRFDIIDYQSITNNFITDIPYAFGTFVSVGLDFLIGKKRNIYIGVTNIIDFTFFNEIDISSKAMAHLYFKF